ncbi:MAG: dihydroorotase family protein [Candidatus Woesearchaeota archaeon]
MIDPHAHLRDYNQGHKETLKHGLGIAFKAGLDGVFEMPNTDPPITSKEKIKERIALADKAISGLGIKIFHGVYAGITIDYEQIKEVVDCHKELFPRVIGLKMFAGHSVGNMGIVNEEEQKEVYRILAEFDYRGVLAVHCEKESLMRPDLWKPEYPFSHALARPPEAEVESVRDQIRFAKEAGFKGTLHIVHISVPEALELIKNQRIEDKKIIIDRINNKVYYKGSGSEKTNDGLKITCGATPHHLILNSDMMNEKRGILLRMNPPLRPSQMQEQLLRSLLNGEIDWIETDHAPHTLQEKNETQMPGIPGLPYYPHFIRKLNELGASQELVDNITHDNIVKAFNIKVENRKRAPDYNLEKEYEFDAFEEVKE